MTRNRYTFNLLYRRSKSPTRNRSFNFSRYIGPCADMLSSLFPLSTTRASSDALPRPLSASPHVFSLFFICFLSSCTRHIHYWTFISSWFSPIPFHTFSSTLFHLIPVCTFVTFFNTAYQLSMSISALMCSLRVTAIHASRVFIATGYIPTHALNIELRVVVEHPIIFLAAVTRTVSGCFKNPAFSFHTPACSSFGTITFIKIHIS